MPINMTEFHPVSADTSVKAERITLGIYRDMPAWRKMQLVEDASRTARQLGFMGIRARYGDESLPELRRRLLGLVLGEETADAVYGHIDSKNG